MQCGFEGRGVEVRGRSLRIEHSVQSIIRGGGAKRKDIEGEAGAKVIPPTPWVYTLVYRQSGRNAFLVCNFFFLANLMRGSFSSTSDSGFVISRSDSSVPESTAGESS